MILQFIATLVIGLGAAGVAHLANRLSGRRLPRWTMPAAAGLAMIGFQAWNEYTWFGRTAAALPEGFEVMRSAEESAWWRPWTYAVPQVTRFAAVDAAGARRNPEVPGQVIADVYLFARFGPVRSVPVLVDCAEGRQAALADDARFGPDGRVIDPDWTALPPGDPLLDALCPPSATG